MDCRCKCCGRRFRRRPQNPDQEYCDRRVCQNKRRQRWRRAKRRSDPTYRDNQRDSQKRWADRHPGYWRRYRADHPDYVERNRRLQRDRDRSKGALNAVTRTGAVLAKSDAYAEDSKAITAYYELIPAKSTDLAKRYASRQIFQLIPVGYDIFRTDSQSCKEITRKTLAGGSARTSVCPRPSP